MSAKYLCKIIKWNILAEYRFHSLENKSDNGYFALEYYSNFEAQATIKLLHLIDVY